jgi:hypothetical protein
MTLPPSTLLRQFLTTRSIVGVAIRQRKCLTEQAELGASEASKARRLATIPSCNVFSAASPQSLVAAWPNWLIVIWYGKN